MTLGGKHFTIATIEDPPFVSLDFVTSNKSWIINGGFEGKLIQTMSEHLNFTYEVVNCNNLYGNLLPNNTWNGIIGKISQNIADIGFSGLTITNQRLEVIDFSNTHSINSVSFIAHSAETIQNFTLFIEPFDSYIWICIVISFMIIFCLEWLISKSYIRLNKFDIEWQTIKIFFRQKIDFNLPAVNSLRIVLFFWLLGCFVLTSSYSGCLSSLMTIPFKVKTIETLEELAIAQKNGIIQVIAVESSSSYHSLKQSKSGVHREIGELVKPVKSPGEGLNIIVNSTMVHAFIGPRYPLSYFKIKFNLRSLYLPHKTEESTLNLEMIGIALQKGFKFKNEVNNYLSNIIKAGLIDYWILQENRKALIMDEINLIPYDQATINRYSCIKLNQVFSPILIFIIGIINSLIIFIIEIISSKIFTHNKENS